MPKIFKTKKLFIIVLTMLILYTAALTACGGDPNKGREAFIPDGRTYRVMLKPEDGWIMVRVSENADTLALQNPEASVLVIIEGYKKTNAADVNVTDIDSLIKFYKLFESAKLVYENEDNTVGELEAIAQKDMKNTQITAGKRQKISIGADLISEYIYLETAENYFVVSYGIQNENYTDAVEKAVNEVIFNIQTD